MADYRRTSTPGVYVRHEKGCPVSNDGARCRCTPSYRSQRRGHGWSPTFKSRDEALEWKSSATARDALETERRTAITFGDLAREWWAGVESGSIGKRKGRKGDGYSATTLQGYERTLFKTLLPAFEDEPAASLDEQRWQAWVDEQAQKGLSRSRIANQLAVVSAIYGWGSRSTRKLVPRNPVRAVELPPNDERPRERVATAKEAAALLDVLPADVRVPYALAFYGGLRRSEIDRLEWRDVDLEHLSITVHRSKSEAGTGRRVPIAAPLVPILQAVEKQSGKVCERSVMSGKLAARARKAWKYDDHEKDEPKKERKPPLEPIGLHECRHTYASLLVAAHYTVKEVMEYLGHADLATTSRYVKMLPQPSEQNPAARLNEYLGAE
jgi:integrase